MGLTSKRDGAAEELRGREALPVWGKHSHDRLQSYDCIGEKHRIVLHIGPSEIEQPLKKKKKDPVTCLT